MIPSLKSLRSLFAIPFVLGGMGGVAIASASEISRSAPTMGTVTLHSPQDNSLQLAHVEAEETPGNRAEMPSMQPTDGNEHHHHQRLDVMQGQPVPSVVLVVHDDLVQGWNLELQTSHFQFAPERVNQSSSATEGHAHLYIDGQKIGRIYSNWYYLPPLPPGRHEITVTLNTNTHEDLYYEDQLISDTAVIDVPNP